MIEKSTRQRKTFRFWFNSMVASVISIAMTMSAAHAYQSNSTDSAIHPVSIEKNVSMLTSDGVKLKADVYHPKDMEKSPTILVRIPFSKSLRTITFSNLVGNMWARHGYTAVIQGTRGRWESEGKYYPMVGERKDGKETLAWLAKQPWYNGDVATWGGSAFGQTQWAISDQKDPGPSACAIYLASTDFHSMFYPGGAFSLYSALNWAINSHGIKDRSGWPTAGEVERGARGFPLIDSDRRVLGKDVPFFRDWVTHSQRDSYWEEIDGKERTKTLRAPVLLVAGWYDPFLPTELNDFIEIKHSASPAVAKPSRLIIGPWTHAGQVTFPNGEEAENFRMTSMGVSLPWFDQILKPGASEQYKRASKPTELFKLPTLPLTIPWLEEITTSTSARHFNDNAASVRIFVMGKNEWRSESEWPLSRAKSTPFYLTSGGHANSITGDGTLSLTKPSTVESFDNFVYDPDNPVTTAGGAMIGRAAGIAKQNKVELREDVLVYSSPALKQDIEVTGPVKVVLNVSTTAPSTDFTAKLVDVHPDGSAYNISDGILRRRYVGPDGKPNAKAVHEITIALWPTSMVFFKGHRIRMEISSSNFPRYDRNPNTGREIATETSPLVAHQQVHHDSIYSSKVILPVIPDSEQLVSAD